MTDDEALDAGFLDFEQIRAERNARVALAGEVAQTIHDVSSVDPDHAESDRHQFGDMILRLASNGDEQEAYRTLLRLRKENRLRAKWRYVARDGLAPAKGVIATTAALRGGFRFALAMRAGEQTSIHPGSQMRAARKA